MAATIGFTPVDTSSISKALASIFEAPLEGGEKRENLHRASAANVVVAGVHAGDIDRATEMVELIAPVHPARFFIPVIVPSLTAARAEVAVACVRVSGGSAVCSEVIRLLLPESYRAAMPSMMRANMLPGLPTEVFVNGWGQSTEKLVRQADQVFFDSLQFKSGDARELIECVTNHHMATVDFNWVRLGMWREGMRSLFDLPTPNLSLSELSRIVVHSSQYSEGVFDVSAFTFAGWMIDRLHINPQSVSSSGWVCSSRTRKSVVVSLVNKAPAEGPLGLAHGLQMIELFARDASGNEHRIAHINRHGALETKVEVGEQIGLSRAIEREDTRSVVERFFLVGDSTINYESALRSGLAMFRLTR